MPDNRKIQSNVEDAMKSLKIESREDKNGDTGPGSYPGRPGEPDCIYYLRTGTCGYGTNCRFNHPPNAGQSFQSTGELPERVGQPECEYYLKTGTCKYGMTCKYHHPKDRCSDSSVVFNSLGLPMRQDAKPCPYYMQTGLCKYGYVCKFHHPQGPQPVSAANVPVAGHTVYGLGGSVVVPSSYAPSLGQLPESSLSKATYGSSSLLQAQQSFMPVVLSPVQGWNVYMGAINPVYVTSRLDLPVFNGLSASHLPERPGQPECRYFMNNGSCKYGSDCKYHHPREKILQSASNFLGPLGLPSRPGQPVCEYYTLYGLCKYGPTCKFDHPMEGYSFTLPSPPIIHSPWLPYQKTPSLVALSETSSSKSSKFTDWIRKGATNHKNQDSNKRDLGDMPGLSDSGPHSSKASSEITHNESD